MTDLEVKAFIEKCITRVSERLPAKGLLMDPFLQSDYECESVGRSLRSGTHLSGKYALHINFQMKDLLCLPSDVSNAEDNHDNQAVGKSAEDNFVETSREFKVEGQRRDINTIFLKLRIADSSGLLSVCLFFSKRVSICFFIGSDVRLHVGHIRNIHFPFDIGADTSISVAGEMVEELELTDQDVSTIANMIDSEIQYHIPSWVSSETPISSSCQDSGYTSETRPEASPMANDSIASPSSLALEILPSGRKYWSDSPKAVGGNSPSRHGTSNLSYEGDANAEEGSSTANSAEKECDGTADSPFGGSSITSGYSEETGGKSSQEEISGSLKDSEMEYINKIATELESLLVSQREELDELQRKHKLAISDLLKDLSQEMCQKVLNMCNLHIPDGEM